MKEEIRQDGYTDLTIPIITTSTEQLANYLEELVKRLRATDAGIVSDVSIKTSMGSHLNKLTLTILE